MRCEDCLPLIEEYFDGEVTSQTAGAVGAHLSTCETCAAALDALSFEQEIYARYDRGGLEVTPELWARVSAEIARTPPSPESPAAGRPFLSRARAHFTAALGALALRPALASSLALFVVAAAAGTLWLSRRVRPNVPIQVAVQNTPAPAVALIPPAPGGADENPKRKNPFSLESGDPLSPEESEPRAVSRAVETALNVNPARRNGGADISVDELLSASSAPKDDPRIVKFRQDEHAPVDDTADIFVKAGASDRDVVASNARPPLEPEQKDVARHVERAQMLLRSIKNAHASDPGDSDISYEKNLSRKLLAENATLQLEAEFKGDKETKQVLDRIEPFLLDIANMGDKPSREEVRSIRERVRSNEIVAALEVY